MARRYASSIGVSSSRELPQRSPRLFALLAFVLPLAGFLINGRYLGSGDTEPAELLPISVLREGDLDFDEFIGGADLPYPYRRIDGRIVSAYPIVPGLLNVPVFALADLLGVDLMENRLRLSLITASLLCAGASLFLYVALLRVLGGSRSQALFFALVFAFGTCVWSVASRGMWQHGPSLFFLCGAYALLFSSEKKARGPGGPQGPPPSFGASRRIAANREGWSGLLLGLAVVNRPANLALALPIAVFIAVHRRRRLPLFLALAAVPAVLIAVYSAVYLDNPLALGHSYRGGSFPGNLAEGLAGLLVSPSRGLLVLSPIFLFSLAGATIAFRRGAEPIWRYLVAGDVLLLLLHASWGMWWGGSGFGYRIILELAPSLVLLIALAWQNLPRPGLLWRGLFTVLLTFSVFVQALGAYQYPSRFGENLDLERARLWDWRDSEIVLLTRKLLGHDARRAAEAEIPTFWWTAAKNDDTIPGWLDSSPGGKTVVGPLELSGWAKSEAGEVDVRILLDDGRVVIPERFPRPDVSRVIPALGDTSRAGFRARIPAPAGPIARRLLVVELRSPRAGVRRLGPIRFRWGDGSEP